MKRREFVKTIAAVGAGMALPSRAVLAAEAQSAAPDATVKRVLVMFKCHFDAGFIDTQYSVVHKYFNQYFPQAIETARTANTQGKRRYVWTTGSWLLFEYLDQASAAERKAMEDAIARGDIAWHALPFTWQTEMLSPSMIEGGLALAQSLDRRFDKVTTGAKMTDVPGHTRGIIPPLAKHGVTFLEIGVNGGSTPALLPPIFLWKDPSGASLAMMYHHEYEGIAVVPGSDLALVTRVRGDNSGPHKPHEIDRIHADLAARFPNAEIVAANLSEMANALAPFRDKLPVVTEEIGDTWIYGCASDPLKVARFRRVSRLREYWVRDAFKVGDETDLQFLRHALLEAEHTWGTDTKTWLDFDNYIPSDLAGKLDTKNYKVVEFSWKEKRQDLLDGIAALPAAQRAEAQGEFGNPKPYEPKPGPRATVHQIGEPIETKHFTVGLDPKTGAITRLHNKMTGREWASEKNPIGLLTYQTLSQEDYRRYRASYLTTKADWAQKDFGKPNIERFGAKNQEWQAEPVEMHLEEIEGAFRILVSLQFKDEEAFQSGRAAFPRRAFLDLSFTESEPEIAMNLLWFGKPATRMPEALWLTFNPIAEDVKGWKLEKSGEWIAPFDVVGSGNRHMHYLQDGFRYGFDTHRFSVDPVDAPVVALGERTPLLFSNEQPDLRKGIHSCLFNNAWGTNYIMWYGEDLLACYVIRA